MEDAKMGWATLSIFDVETTPMVEAAKLPRQTTNMPRIEITWEPTPQRAFLSNVLFV